MISKSWIPFARTLAHALCLAPLTRLALGAFEIAGFDLGANPVEKLLRDLGWWSLALLVACLAVTPLRRLSGQPWLHLLRRPLGLYAFAYAALHFVVYGVLDRELDFATIGEDIAERPFIAVGLAALLFLAPLAFTSTKSWIRRLGKNWQRLHYLAYPAAGLGAWHYYWQIKKDLSQPKLFIAILAGLLGVRLGFALWKRVRERSKPQSP